MNVKSGTEAAQFLFWEYMNSNFFAVWVLSGVGGFYVYARVRLVSYVYTTVQCKPAHKVRHTKTTCHMILFHSLCLCTYMNSEHMRSAAGTQLII